MNEPAAFSTVKAYSLHAPFYDLWAACAESHASERALTLAGLSREESVLEVAVGTGGLFVKVVKAVGAGRVAGVDLSPDMLRRALRRVARKPDYRHPLCRADARQLPFPDQEFDVLLNCYMLDLMEEARMAQVLTEFARVLKHSGRLVVVNMATLSRRLNATWMWLYRHAPMAVGGCRPVPQVGRLLAEGGWQIAAREFVSQNGFRSELFLARRAR